jgi:hypothetical protein
LLLSGSLAACSLNVMSKWGVIAAGAAVVALVAGALLLTLGGSRKVTTYDVITTTDSARVPVKPVVPVKQVANKAPASAPACRGGAGDESDPTGDDRSSVRRTRRSCPGARDDQAGDSNSDQGGDNQAGDRGGDNQAGDRGSDDQAGDRGDDNQAGDNRGAATNEP